MNKMYGYIGIITVIGIGIAMILYPDMMEGASTGGRRAFFKQIIATIWGIPAGIVTLLIGAGLVYSEVKGGTDDAEEIAEA